MSQSVPTEHTPRWRPAVIAALAMLALLMAVAILYPGWYSYDSAWQLMQARTKVFSNLQPPLMQVVWSAILDLGLPPGALMVAHLVALALGTALIGISMRRFHGLVLPLLLLWPPFLVLFGHLWIDVSMTAALTLATGWIAWTRVNRRSGLVWFALLPIVYAIGTRHNAIFASLPLLLLLVSGAAGAPRRRFANAFLAIGLGFVALAGLALFSRQVVVLSMPVWPTLAIWDLSAASVASDEMLLPAGMRGPTLTVDELRPLVNPDTSMSILIGARSGVNPGVDEPLRPDVARELLQRWLSLPLTHPQAWLRHRAGVTWSLLGPQRADKLEPLFIVPQYTPYRDNPPIRVNDTAANGYLLKWVRAAKHTLLCTPLTYLLMAVAAAGLALRPRFGGDRALVLSLSASSWLNVLPLAVLAPAAEWRYALWSMLAGLLAFLLALDSRRVRGDSVPS